MGPGNHVLVGAHMLPLDEVFLEAILGYAWANIQLIFSTLFSGGQQAVDMLNIKALTESKTCSKY